MPRLKTNIAGSSSQHERFALGLDVFVNGLLATPTEGRLTR
jgi:hypothetical protein